ncbi:MAG: DUF87 domain-containing protein [Candidatus Heimdallarchaeota archaeon]|nr:DUF87 domain-containing protein [Candidatus Heimdallarchaeota archaeon]
MTKNDEPAPIKKYHNRKGSIKTIIIEVSIEVLLIVSLILLNRAEKRCGHWQSSNFCIFFELIDLYKPLRILLITLVIITTLLLSVHLYRFFKEPTMSKHDLGKNLLVKVKTLFHERTTSDDTEPTIREKRIGQFVNHEITLSGEIYSLKKNFVLEARKSFLFGMVAGIVFIVMLLSIEHRWILWLLGSPFLVILFGRSVHLFVKKERIVFARIVSVNEDENANETSLTKKENATLPLQLGTTFNQVILHQTAANGKMVKCSLYASKVGYFKYPSAATIFNTLEGICDNVNLTIKPFTEADFEEFTELVTSDCNTSNDYFAGIISEGEPAYQSTDDLYKSVDKLARNVIMYSRTAEVHSFSTIRKGGKGQFRLRNIKSNLLSRRLLKEKEGDFLPDDKREKYEHFTKETSDMRKTCYVKGEIAIIVRGANANEVRAAIEKLDAGAKTVYDGFQRKIEFEKINPQTVLDKIAAFELVKKKRGLISGYSAKAIINGYSKPLSCVPFRREVTTPLSEERMEETHPIILGETAMGETIRANLEDYKHHRLIVGPTGYGKSDWIRAEIEQINKQYPEVHTLTIDFSGEHSLANVQDEAFVVYEGLSETNPLYTNPFDDGYVDSNEQLNYLFKYFCEVLRLRGSNEYTPQMERVLQGTLQRLLARENEERHFAYFELDLHNYVEDHQLQLISGEKTRTAIQNRMSMFEYALRKIVYVPKSNWDPSELERKHQVINLRRIRDQSMKSAIVSLILYKLRNYLVSRQKKGLRIIVYLEEAQLVAPELYHRGTAADLSFVEECLTEIRKWGVSITLIGTQTEAITSLGLESQFLMNFGSLSKELMAPMNYDLNYEKNMETIHSLKKFQCDIKLPDMRYLVRAVTLPRPTRVIVSEKEYQYYLETMPQYERLRTFAGAIEESMVYDDPIEEREKKEVVKELFNQCLHECPFYFIDEEKCLLARKTKLKGKIEEIAGNVLIRICGNWSNVRKAFENREEQLVEQIRDLIEEGLSENDRIRRGKITEEDKDKLVKCVVFYLLKGLIMNADVPLEETLEYLYNWEGAEGEELEEEDLFEEEEEDPFGEGEPFSVEEQPRSEEGYSFELTNPEPREKSYCFKIADLIGGEIIETNSYQAFIKNYCPRDTSYFKNCLLAYFQKEIAVLAQLLLNRRWLLRDRDLEDLNTGMLGRLIPSLEAKARELLVATPRGKERLTKVGEGLIKQMVFCANCLAQGIENAEGKQGTEEAKIIYGAVMSYYLAKRTITPTVIGQLREKIERRKKERKKGEEEQSMVTVEEVIKQAIDQKKKKEEEGQKKKEEKEREKTAREEQKEKDDRPPYVPNINYEILLEVPKLEEGTISEEALQELKNFYEPYIDCGECIKRFEYDIFEDCPEVRTEAEKKLAEEPVGAWKKNPPIRFCLAKIIAERVRRLEESEKEEKEWSVEEIENYQALCRECSKRISIKECFKKREKVRELMTEGEETIRETWEKDKELRPCIAKELMERRDDKGKEN